MVLGIKGLSHSSDQGFCCIKHLKNSGRFLQPFYAFRRTFLSSALDHSAEGDADIGEQKKSARNSFRMQGTTAEGSHLP